MILKYVDDDDIDNVDDGGLSTVKLCVVVKQTDFSQFGKQIGLNGFGSQVTQCC